MEAYKRVAAARAKGRPTGSDFIEHIFEGFVELHGDRRFADDKAIVAGVAMLNDMPVTVIAIDRGKDTKEKIKRNFGSAHPEGYRKALRQMKLAEKFNRPVICFIDTSGAYCGIGAEERGQAQAIAENLMEMMTLKVPIISKGRAAALWGSQWPTRSGCWKTRFTRSSRRRAAPASSGRTPPRQRKPPSA